MNKTLAAVALGTVLAATAAGAQAACLSDSQVADFVAAREARTPAADIENLDEADAACARGKGSDILEHPLNAVVWLAGALAREGLALKPGDLVSLGSFSPLLPPKAGQTVMVTYEGLARTQPVVVTFK